MQKEFTGKIYSINISKEKGTIKKPVGKARIGKQGLVGDVHYGVSLRHVSIISIERINEFSKEAGKKVLPGEFAENITIENIDLSYVNIYDRFRIGEAELEVIQIGKDEEVDSNKVFRIIGKAVMVHEGLFCKVISSGHIKVGDKIIYIKNTKH